MTLVLIMFVGFRSHIPENIRNMFSPVSVVSQVLTNDELKSQDGRTNILVLGVDKRTSGNGGNFSMLTDTIIVVSVDKFAKNPVVISIPRDLWVYEAVPPSKINAVYPIALAREKRLNPNDEISVNEIAIKETISAVYNVVGIPIHYYAIIGFDVFKDSVDAIGGINVVVDQSFDDYLYPIEGMEAAMPESLRYKQLHFNAGLQEMDGETALEFSRSRHSTNVSEQGDFARARRQQKVIESLKDSILRSETLLNPIKMKDLYETYKKNVKTDITFAEMLLFYRMTENDIGQITRIVLSNETLNSNSLGSGTLIAPLEDERNDRFGGQYALIPTDRTYDNIHALIRSALFPDN